MSGWNAHACACMRVHARACTCMTWLPSSRLAGLLGLHGGPVPCTLYHVPCTLYPARQGCLACTVGNGASSRRLRTGHRVSREGERMVQGKASEYAIQHSLERIVCCCLAAARARIGG